MHNNISNSSWEMFEKTGDINNYLVFKGNQDISSSNAADGYVRVNRNEEKRIGDFGD